MAAKDGRGGARPGAGRKPLPPDDIARIRRMLASSINKSQISKTLNYSQMTIGRYAKQFEEEDGDEE